MSEASLQTACVQWFNLQYPQYRGMLLHVPNGGYRESREGVNLKKQGVVAGVADLLLLIPRKGFGCLCIEMKYGRGKQSDLQREWEEKTSRHGNLYQVCRSLEEFMDTVNSYLL
ncbi:VRR-NUC domain-containing protein [Millionella massiliensis]|uniref:VRR-NUC domain-containing protein n=1 Tax=Millionella massiliensis TaxID=1871023 RepID=UPI0008DB1A67|nr:VRR-NUC domain-containing protein [Millionella massiliensis]